MYIYHNYDNSKMFRFFVEWFYDLTAMLVYDQCLILVATVWNGILAFTFKVAWKILVYRCYTFVYACNKTFVIACILANVQQDINNE